jgi:hypothetical protein
MSVRSVAGLGALLVLLGSVACGSSSSSSSSTTSPSTTTYSETFSGTVIQGTTAATPDIGPSDSLHHFTVHQPGNIDATLTDIQPLNTITLGLGLGIWDATGLTCTLASQVTSPSARLNLTIAASVSSPGELCVGVFDVGNIGDNPITYTVLVNHT